MDRRAFISGITLGLLAAPLTVEAQHASKIPRIGIIEHSASWEPFLEGLRGLGYVEGQNIAIERRSTGGKPDRLANIAAELGRQKVAALVTLGTPAPLAAKQATQTIPIVMIAVADPQRTGLVASFARPGGNITGLTILGPELAAKRLQLLKEVVPKVSRVAFLWNPDNPGTAINFEKCTGWGTDPRRGNAIDRGTQPHRTGERFSRDDEGAPRRVHDDSRPHAPSSCSVDH